MEMIAGDLFIDVNLSSLEHADLMESKSWIIGREIAPTEITTVPPFKNDIHALSKLLFPTKPPLCLIHGELINKTIFGFGDASGGSFGSSWEVKEKIIF